MKLSKAQRRVAIYGASKTVHAPLWVTLRDQGFNIVSSWIDLPRDKTGQQIDHSKLWRDIEADVRRADFLVLYCLPGELLKGALVELGMALALGKTAFVYGHRDNDCIGTFRAHPLFVEAGPTLDLAGCIDWWRENSEAGRRALQEAGDG